MIFTMLAFFMFVLDKGNTLFLAIGLDILNIIWIGVFILLTKIKGTT